MPITRRECIAAAVVTPMFSFAVAAPADPIDDRPEGIARDRWDVAIETADGATMIVECGAIRERVSQELARAVFDAVKRELERQDAEQP